MKGQSLKGGQELLCVNVDKVYDWIINQAPVNLVNQALTFPTNSPCQTGFVITGSTCDVVQSSVVEVGPRTNRTFVIGGAEVTLQRVNLLKTLSVTVTVTGTLAGADFTLVSAPVTTTVNESFFLCAPEGTTVDVTVTDVECGATVTCTGTAATANISAIICQSIQVVAPVTIELTAAFCNPRENFIATCPAPAIPPQCPTVFPTPPTPPTP